MALKNQEAIEHLYPGTEGAYAGSKEEALDLLLGVNYGSDVTIPAASRKVNGRLTKGIHQLYLKDDPQRFTHTNYLRNGYTSFSGSDSTVAILFQKGEPTIIGEAQTLTYSLFAPQEPVYNLGDRKPAGFIRGPRTIAGTLIFTVFDRHVLLSAFHKAYRKYGDVTCLDQEYLPDELPPFDLQVTFLNEFGQSAGLTIHDVRITSEGQVMSIEDMITENTMQYVASDITLMQPDFVDESR